MISHELFIITSKEIDVTGNIGGKIEKNFKFTKIIEKKTENETDSQSKDYGDLKAD